MKRLITIVAMAATLVAASSLTPPVLPMFVRNPYLNAWFGSARAEPWESWPMFWTKRELGFSVMVHIPSSKTVFPLVGRLHDVLDSNSTQ